jgi:hypothetical protein
MLRRAGLIIESPQGPVLLGVHLDYREGVKLFEQPYTGSIL